MSVFSSLSSLKLSTPVSATALKSSVSGDLAVTLGSIAKLPQSAILGGPAAKAAAPAAAPMQTGPLVISGKFDKIYSANEFKWSNAFSGIHLKDIATIVEPSLAGKFHTQNAAANYIADSLPPAYAGANVDKRVHDAVRDACANWHPGQDLAQLVHDAVKKALTGVISDNPPQNPGALFQTPTPDSIANQMAGYIRANGSTPIDAAEHIVAAERAYRPPA